MKSNSGTTPFPNVLIDAFMPKLKDTEWRVLCVVVRQTLGWKAAGGHRKGQDWLSHSQLKLRTGRSNTAVSEAIQGLVERGLIAVRDAGGNTLHQATDRMRHNSRLYFSVSSGMLALIHTLTVSGFRKPETTKQTHTKENLIDRKLSDEPLRINRGWVKAGNVESGLEQQTGDEPRSG